MKKNPFNPTLERDVLHDIRKDPEVNRLAVLFRIQTDSLEVCEEPEGNVADYLKKILPPKLYERVRIFTGRRVRSGLGGKGGSDLFGFLRGSARVVALEVKRSGVTKGSPEQEAFLAMVRLGGGFGAVVDSVEAARAALERAGRGEAR